MNTTLTPLEQENADLRAKLAAAVRCVSTAYPTTSDELTAVINQLMQITHVPAETVTVWSGYDDDERGFPEFTTRQAAQQYAEHRYREDWVNWGNAPDEIVEIGWSERKAYTDARDGRAGMFDLTVDDGSTGYVVRERTVHPTADAALLAETAEAVPLGSRVRVRRAGGPYDGLLGTVVALHPYGEARKVGVMVDGREGVAVFPADDVVVLPRKSNFVLDTDHPALDVTIAYDGPTPQDIAAALDAKAEDDRIEAERVR